MGNVWFLCIDRVLVEATALSEIKMKKKIKDNQRMKKHTKLRSPIPYVGGKHYLRNWIVSYFDYSVLTYVELFGGAGHILLAKKPHKIEVYNDIDGELVNFFLILKERGKELARELGQLPFSRKLFEQWRKEPLPQNKFQRAVRYFYMLRCSFAGSKNSWGYGFSWNKASDYHSAVKLLQACQDRIKNVQIDCRDFREVLKSIEKTKQENILLYVDPPYHGTENYYKAYTFTTKDHTDLAERLNILGCKILISYYEHPEIYKLYPRPKWTYHKRDSVKFSHPTRPGNQKPRGHELLIMNYNIT